MATSPPTLRLYFSFRSPFSWLAHHRLGLVDALPWGALRKVPVYPPNPEAVARVAGSPAKTRYTREDAERTAAAYGFQVRWPEAVDTDWARPHCAFLWAEERGRGRELASSIFAARFLRGEDVGTDAALSEAADECGLDPRDAIAAADAPEWRERLQQGFLDMREDAVFGVPTLVIDGERFWGNDRLEWALRELARRRGETVPDLSRDPWAPPLG